MTDVRPGTVTEPVELTVHNEGSSSVDVQFVVHGDAVVVDSLPLEGGETGTLSAPAGSSVEVHTPGGTATATATRGAIFVLRDARVLVVPN